MSLVNRNRRRGFTLLEVMVALAVMAFASVGALAGLMAASREMREGQLRQYESVLIDASFQRLRLADKQTLISQAIPAGTLPSSVTAVGASPWQPDPTVGSDPLDLGTGAFFKVLPNGEITKLTGITGDCTSTSVPDGTYCRETVIMKGASVAAPGAIVASAGQSVATVWVRISRKGELASKAVLAREVVAQ